MRSVVQSKPSTPAPAPAVHGQDGQCTSIRPFKLLLREHYVLGEQFVTSRMETVEDPTFRSCEARDTLCHSKLSGGCRTLDLCTLVVVLAQLLYRFTLHS